MAASSEDMATFERAEIADRLLFTLDQRKVIPSDKAKSIRENIDRCVTSAKGQKWKEAEEGSLLAFLSARELYF